MASGPATAKNTTVATKVMKVDVIASGRRTPDRRMTHIMVGPAPDWNGVRYAAQALIPPAMIMSFSRTPGCTCRATTHNRVPPPNQSMEASPSPTTIHHQWRCSSARATAWTFSPYTASTTTTPASEITAKSSRPRRSRRGVRARAIGGETRGARGPGLGLRRRFRRTPGPRSRAPIILGGYASLTRPRDHPQRPAAQSQGHHRRAAARRPHGDHRTVRVRQEHPGVRYPLRRGPAPLHRVALDLRQAISRADAKTAGRRDRGDLSGGGHRAEEPHDEQPLDGGHGHGDLRLPAAPLGAYRHPALREVRERRESGHRPRGGGHVERGSRNAEVGTGGQRRRFRVSRSAFRLDHRVPPAAERPPPGRGSGGTAARGGVRAGPARRHPGPA